MSCPHGLNQAGCLKCFHAPKPAKPETPQPVVKAPLHPIVAAIKQRAAAGASSDMAMQGVRPDGEPAAQPEPPGMPRPVYANAPQAAVPGQRAQASANVVAPFSYANDPGRFDKHGLWHPPRHPSIVDGKPRHPNAGGRR
jgi:hypothetical protein